MSIPPVFPTSRVSAKTAGEGYRTILTQSGLHVFHFRSLETLPPGWVQQNSLESIE